MVIVQCLLIYFCCSRENISPQFFNIFSAQIEWKWLRIHMNDAEDNDEADADSQGFV